MEQESDEDDSMPNPFIVPDSQKPEEDEKRAENRQLAEEQKSDGQDSVDEHVTVLKNLEISCISGKSSHEQGQSARELKEEIAVQPLSTNAGSASSTDKSVGSTQLGSDEGKYHMNVSFTPEYQPQKADEVHKDLYKSSSSCSTSIEVNRSVSDVSSVSGSSIEYRMPPAVEAASDSLIELLKSRDLSRQASIISSGEKYGSCSSGYPSTSSTGQRSIDLLSSPDNQPPHPFAIPTKVAPVHKPYGSSSGGSSSEDGKEASPKKSRWLQACKEKNSDHLESSGESQGGYSHDNFTPAEISSREVTHLDSPHMRSTPAELSFECLQLSGENRQMTTSVYSLPDPLHASPSDTRLFEVSDAASSSGEMIEGRHEPDVKKDSEAVLPKWVEKDIESKRIDFENMSESTDSALKSSGSSSSSPTHDAIPPSLQRQSASQSSQLAYASEEASARMASSSQGYDVKEVDADEVLPESCVYPPLQGSIRMEPRSCAPSGDYTDASPHEYDKKDVSSPSLISPSQTSIHSLNTKVVHLWKSSQVSNASVDEVCVVKRSEEDAMRPELSSAQDEPEVDTEQRSPSKTVEGPRHALVGSEGTDPNPSKAGSNFEKSGEDLNLQFSVSDKDANVPQKQFSDMEIEMSQDLFNQPLTELESTATQPTQGQVQGQGQIQGQVQRGDHKATMAESDSKAATRDVVTAESKTENPILEDFNLFLSQTQPGPSQITDPESRKFQTDACSTESPLVTLKKGNGAKLREEEGNDSVESSKTTPSQSILNKDGRSEQVHSTEPCGTESSKEQIKRLHVPKGILDNVSCESSSSSRFDFALPSEGGSFRPLRTLTPPFRNVGLYEQQTEEIPVQPHEEASSAFKDKEIPSLVEKAERVVSKGYKTVAVATKEPFQLSKVSGLLENVNTEGNDEFLEQSETIFSKALRSTKGSVNRHPAPSVPDDPFEFEDKDEPLSKRRKYDLPSGHAKKSPPKPKFADEIKEPGSETETYCRSVSQVITVRQIVETRKFVTKFYSMKDDSLIGTTEFSDDGTATKSFTEEFSAPVVEVVPITSVSMVLEENESKGKKVPKRHTPKRSCKRSPNLKRRRSSSSTPPEGVTGVPKRRLMKALTPIVPKEKGKTECASSNVQSKEQNDTKKSSGPNTKGKSEYEMLLELALAEEKEFSGRQTRSSKKSGDRWDDETIHVGTDGLGKWLDNHYYPGKVIENMGAGRFKMRFHDQKELILTGNSIIPHDLIRPGQHVCARDNEDSYYYQGIVCSILQGDAGAHICYEIKMDDSGVTKRVNVGDIMLEGRQIFKLKMQLGATQDNPDGSAAHKSVDFGTRSITEDQRTPAKKFANVPETQRAVGRKRQNELRPRRDASSHPLASSSNVEAGVRSKKAQRQKGSGASRKNERPSESQPVCKTKKKKDPLLKIAERWQKIEKLRKDPNSEDLFRMYGCLPNDSTLFQGYVFIVTFIHKKASVNEEVAFRCQSFNRSHLACQLTAGGGSIADCVENLLESPKNNMILIAPIHQKTLKYYFALSYGIPCVTHFWVIDCCKENRMLPFDVYFLEAGIDQITGNSVFAHRRKQPLRGFKIYLHALKEDTDEVSLAVRFSGADIVSELPKLSASKTRDLDYILIGDGVVLKRNLMMRAKRLKVPCVSIKWFYQCVIHGEYVHPNSHTLFSAIKK